MISIVYKKSLGKEMASRRLKVVSLISAESGATDFEKVRHKQSGERAGGHRKSSKVVCLVNLGKPRE